MITEPQIVVDASSHEPAGPGSRPVIGTFCVYIPEEIVLASGSSARIDRLMIDGDSVFVIDYKSSRKEGNSYKDQVNKYVDAVKQIYPNKKVEGYIVYLDEITAEAIQ